MKRAERRASIVLPWLATLTIASDAASQTPPAQSPQVGEPFGPATPIVVLQGRARAFRLMVGSRLCPTSRFQTEFRSLTERLEAATLRLRQSHRAAPFGIVQDGHNPIETPQACDDERVAGMMPEYRALIADVEAVAGDPREDR